ncbi:hypothetical protein HAZT_HAZT001444 [Hyalella azteca]|uniref:EndoU domain-containing protein n=1 Tax=Hyalella azteca TaxID=294128 RepID=A0A6A0GS35_HYAAZ|nr:hypothetical protein HAZT_HAZT001444 [Hyalella azteca]
MRWAGQMHNHALDGAERTTVRQVVSATLSVQTSPIAAVTNAEILAITEELGALDANNVATSVVIDMQGKTTSGSTADLAPGPLFVTVPELTADTFVLFEALRDNYAPYTNVAEDNTLAEQAEVASFLDAVLATPLMVRLDQFMTEKQLITGTLRQNIEEIWFTLYSRSGSTLGSSGFEHSFVGELEGGDVGGFHNWVSYEIEEAAGNTNYRGYIEYTDLGTSGYVFTNQFTWYDAEKPIGGYLIGTSPEYELAVYTLCFFARPNAQCHVQTNGVEYFIQTYELQSNGLTLVGSAYPGVV